jgi:ectoine hydroxylase-related dioxygenase (phytanoyl-CoA dioxygenase family)
MEAAAGNIIVADMQAMTARDSFVMMSHPPRQTAAAAQEHGFQDNHVNCYLLDNRKQKYLY